MINFILIATFLVTLLPLLFNCHLPVARGVLVFHSTILLVAKE